MVVISERVPGTIVTYQVHDVGESAERDVTANGARRKEAMGRRGGPEGSACMISWKAS